MMSLNGEMNTASVNEIDAVDTGAGLRIDAEKANKQLPVPVSLLDAIAERQVNRKFWIKSINRQKNSLGALLRLHLGWSKELPEAQAKLIEKQVQRILAAAVSNGEHAPEDAAIVDLYGTTIGGIVASIEPCARQLRTVVLGMEREAKKLPVYRWAESIKGFGKLGLAVIVAEAGDLSNYPSKGHLWKRLGLAPFEGHAYSTWRMKGGLSSDDWVEAGYSPKRRAEIYAVISTPLFRVQSAKHGPYRLIYDRRRAATAVAHPDWTKEHSHMDGLRVMTKILVRDLWVAWRKAAQQPA